MEQTRALNALEPFVVLSKSATSPRAASDLITQATSAPNTYVFAELLQTPNIQALRDAPEHAKYLKLLEIFSWGTWADYQANAQSLPELSAQQQQKLRLLTLLTLAASNSPTSSTLTYQHLTSALSLSSTRELESLLTTAIYSSLITATLDPSHGVAIISSVSPLRDLSPGSVPSLLNQLAMWSERCESALTDLDAKIAEVKSAAKLREQRKLRAKDAADKEREKLEEEAKDDDKKGKKRSLRSRVTEWGFGDSGGNDMDAMDLDDGGSAG
ncbi:PCI-domain-containing protein, partial [Rhizodiscina lignyota]